MADFHLIIHVYERQDAPWTYSCRFMRKLDSENIRVPISMFTGTLPWNQVDDPRTVLRLVLERLTDR